MSWQVDEETVDGDYMVMTKSSMKPSSSASSTSSIGATAAVNSRRSAFNMASTAECHVIPTEVDCNVSMSVVFNVVGLSWPVAMTQNDNRTE